MCPLLGRRQNFKQQFVCTCLDGVQMSCRIKYFLTFENEQKTDNLTLIEQLNFKIFNKQKLNNLTKKIYAFHTIEVQKINEVS